MATLYISPTKDDPLAGYVAFYNLARFMSYKSEDCGGTHFAIGDELHGYGCWCGQGGKGLVMDEFDEACKASRCTAECQSCFGISAERHSISAETIRPKQHNFYLNFCVLVGRNNCFTCPVH